MPSFFHTIDSSIDNTSLIPIPDIDISAHLAHWCQAGNTATVTCTRRSVACGRALVKKVASLRARLATREHACNAMEGEGITQPWFLVSLFI